MISTIEKWDELTGEGVCFPALQVTEQELGCGGREFCSGWQVGETPKISSSCKRLSSVCKKVDIVQWSLLLSSQHLFYLSSDDRVWAHDQPESVPTAPRGLAFLSFTKKIYHILK